MRTRSKTMAVAALGLVVAGILTGCSSSSTPPDTGSPSAAASQGSDEEELNEPSAESSAEGDQG
ncbi:MAG: hypothetical protein KGN78_09000 [Actinomycetales bacterium]|nr:hypothetical protein [Actinomycetales bacterium]